MASSERTRVHAEAAELLRQLVRCRSDTPATTEAALVAVLEGYLTASAVHTWRSEVCHERPNLYARVGAGEPTLLLNGHTDTVPAASGWTTDPFGAELVNGRVFGVGACDMKGGLAACALTLAALARRAEAPRGSVLFVAVVDEERGALGARHAVGHDSLVADAAIIAEPTNLRVVTSCNGQINFSVRLYGRAAHSSRPGSGHDALADAWQLAEALEASGERYLIGKLSGGVAPNVVAASCELQIDRRVSPPETLGAAEAQFAGLLAAATADAPHPAEYETSLAVPPFALGDDHFLPRIVGELAGHRGPYIHSLGTTDAAWFAAAGIPTIMLGPGDPDVAHAPNEQVAVSDVVSAAEILELASDAVLSRLAHG